MDFNELFVVRPTSSEMEEFMITIGNEIATEQRFENVESAQEVIARTDWNLVAVLAHKMAMSIVEEFNKKNEEEEA